MGRFGQKASVFFACEQALRSLPEDLRREVLALLHQTFPENDQGPFPPPGPPPETPGPPPTVDPPR
jgi:hypothetical protein